MSDSKNIRLDLVLALAANWRAEGEYWKGTPADARSQHCADQLLRAFGLPLDAHTRAGSDYGVLLKAHGIAANTVPPDRAAPLSKNLFFMEEQLPAALKGIKTELESGKPARSLDTLVREKLSWAHETGYSEGFEDGANARKTRYKRPSKK